MAHDVSAVLKRAIYSAGTERVFIQLTEIYHPVTLEAVRITSDDEPTMHGGNRYEPIEIGVTFPDDREAVQPVAQITIPNVHEDIMALLRSIEQPADVRLFLVLDDDPERIERGPFDMKLFNVRYDIDNVQGSLRPDTLLNEPYPGGTYNTTAFPGL